MDVEKPEERDAAMNGWEMEEQIRLSSPFENPP